tara:strand:- start:237 stop:407 length:171 start_codon:yes stop_codon:yes gene_type:complete
MGVMELIQYFMELHQLVVVEVVHTEVNKVMLVVLVVEEELELVVVRALEEQEIHLL